MDGKRLPGPERETGSSRIDDGTRIRMASPKPGPIRGTAQPAAPKPKAQPAAQSTKVTNWPSKLKWAQFPKVQSAPDGSAEHAQTAADIRPTPKVQIGREHGRLFLKNVEVTLSFNKENSWVVDGKQTEPLLRHEQGHWDISGLAARDLHRTLTQLRADSKEDLKSKIESTLTRSQAAADRIGKQYEDATDHGRNAVKQKEWEKKIAGWIQDKNATLPDSAQ